MTIGVVFFPANFLISTMDAILEPLCQSRDLGLWNF